MQPVAAACRLKLQHIGRTVPALGQPRHPGGNFLPFGAEFMPLGPAAQRHVEHKHRTQNKDDEVEHSGFPRSLFFGPPEPALTRAASIVPYFAQNFAPKVPSDVQKFRPEILSEKIEKNA